MRSAKDAVRVGVSRSPTSSAASAGRIRRRRSRRARCSRKRAKKLGFGSKRTMRARAGPVRGHRRSATRARSGLITYMRTDSTRVAESAALQARDYLRALFGEEYLADRHRSCTATARAGEHAGRARGGASHGSDAPAGARPALPQGRPVQALPAHLAALHGVADGAGGVRHDDGRLRPCAGDDGATSRSYLFRSTGSVIKFPGFLALYREAREEGRRQGARGRAGAADRSRRASACRCARSRRSQHFTEPPPRFSEASLVKELERLGIGRPSTYASDHLDARRPPLRAARAASVLPDGARRERRARDGQAVPRHLQRRLHVGDGGGARQDRGRPRSAGSSVLKEFYGPFETSLNDGRRRRAHRRGARPVGARERSAAPSCGGKLVREGWILRAVRRVREPSEDVQVHASAQGRAEAGGADGRTSATSAAR